MIKLKELDKAYFKVIESENELLEKILEHLKFISDLQKLYNNENNATFLLNTIEKSLDFWIHKVKEFWAYRIF